MADTTPRLKLRRPTDVDFVTYNTDLNDNHNILDAAIDRVCTSAARPALPYTGMRAWETDTGDFIVFNGTDWVILATTNDHHYRASQSVLAQQQSFTNNVITKVNYPTVLKSTPDITRSADNLDYTFNRAGLWQLEAGLFWASGTTGIRHLYFALPTNNLTIYAGSTFGASVEGVIHSVALLRRFAVGDKVSVWAKHTQGAVLTSFADGVGEVNHVSFAWLRP